MLVRATIFLFNIKKVQFYVHTDYFSVRYSEIWCVQVRFFDDSQFCEIIMYVLYVMYVD